MKSSRKIGILTIHDTTNFGSLFQTYATYKVLSDKGYDCEIIDYKCDTILKREKQKSLAQSEDYKDVLRYFIYGPRINKKYKMMNGFMMAHTRWSQRYDAGNIREANRHYSTFFVGSDIVWGLSITNIDFTYFLDFVEDEKKKFAYASSMGEKWNSNYDRIEEYISKFDKIAVREEQAQVWIKEICSRDVEVVSDPTMLIAAEDWRSLARQSNMYHKLSKEKYILIYFAIGNVYEDAKAFAKKYGYKIYHVNYRKPVKGITAVRPYHPSDWLALVENASLMLTASYHGMLFSLYFNNEFYYYNRGWKSRMNSLAAYLGINHREAVERNLIEEKPINYASVNALLKDKVKHSYDVLDTYRL